MRLANQLINIFLIIYSLSSSVLAFADSNFEQVVESYKGKDFIVRLPKDDERLDYKTAFPGELLLGITKRHFYILVDDIRIDGMIPPLPSEKVVGSIDDGLLIRFPDLEKEKVSELKEALSKESGFQGFTWSCVNTACKNLRRRLGVRLAGNRDRVFPSTAFDEILMKGFKDKSGNSVRFEIYKTSRFEFSLEEMAKRHQGFEIGCAMFSATLSLIVGVGVGTLGVTAYSLVRNDIKKNFNRCKLFLRKVTLSLPLSVPPPPNSPIPNYRGPESFFRLNLNESE